MLLLQVLNRGSVLCYCCTLILQVGVFDFGSRSSPLVLLLDRNDDPVTPLLTQWTYQVWDLPLLALLLLLLAATASNSAGCVQAACKLLMQVVAAVDLC